MMPNMSGITLTQAQAQLDAYLAAETAVLGGQEYKIAGRMMRRADLLAIQAGILLWNERVQNLTFAGQGRSRCITVAPR
jgi:hypothetical protein